MVPLRLWTQEGGDQLFLRLGLVADFGLAFERRTQFRELGSYTA
jgi:hypothetical protein